MGGLDSRRGRGRPRDSWPGGRRYSFGGAPRFCRFCPVPMRDQDRAPHSLIRFQVRQPWTGQQRGAGLNGANAVNGTLGEGRFPPGLASCSRSSTT